MPGMFRDVEPEQRSPLLRSLVWMLVGIGLVGLVLFGAQKYLFNRGSEPVATDSQTPGPPTPTGQTADNSASKPSPVGQSQVPGRRCRSKRPHKRRRKLRLRRHKRRHRKLRPAPESPAPRTAAARQEAETPPAPAPQGAAVTRTVAAEARALEPKPAVEPKPGAGQSVQFLTDPPGAQVTVDGDPSLACKTPCMLPLGGGRHALTVQLAGYRPYPRVFSVPQDGDLFLRLSKTSGTLSITSEPPGATIEVNGDRARQAYAGGIQSDAGHVSRQGGPQRSVHRFRR